MNEVITIILNFIAILILISFVILVVTYLIVIMIHICNFAYEMIINAI